MSYNGQSLLIGWVTLSNGTQSISAIKRVEIDALGNPRVIYETTQAIVNGGQWKEAPIYCSTSYAHSFSPPYPPPEE